jgi:hypothetical protein
MIETLIFALTGSTTSAVLIGVGVLSAWMVLSNYVLLDRWTVWQSAWEPFAFIVASVLVAVAVTLMSRWILLAAAKRIVVWTRPVANADTARAVAPERVDHAFDVGDVRLMLQMIAAEQKGLARQFIEWKCRHLSKLPERSKDTRWWWKGPAMVGSWLPALWFPAMLLWLYWIPTTATYPRVASVAMALRVGLFAPRAEGIGHGGPPSSSPQDWVIEDLTRDEGTNVYRRVLTADVSNGVLSFRTTSFPHFRHRLRVVCIGETPHCKVAANGSNNFGPDLDLEVRNGEVRFNFIQVNQPERLLDMRVWLIGTDGTTLDEMYIEPARPESL